jgi:hypothetical protein
MFDGLLLLFLFLEEVAAELFAILDLSIGS